MKTSARYAKIVEWSDEDQCYVGSAPGLLLGGCHGDDEREVFKELCSIVEEVIALYEQDGKPLPSATSGRDFANRMQSTSWPTFTDIPALKHLTPLEHRLPERRHTTVPCAVVVFVRP